MVADRVRCVSVGADDAGHFRVVGRGQQLATRAPGFGWVPGERMVNPLCRGLRAAVRVSMCWSRAPGRTMFGRWDATVGAEADGPGGLSLVMLCYVVRPGSPSFPLTA